MTPIRSTPVNGLGEFLRARRAALSPEDAGLPRGVGLRRTPGLRREEVASLAGISTYYYVRLEQGRERSPSAQVLDALAKALALEPDAIRLLHQLAGPPPRPHSIPRPERVTPNLFRLLMSWTGQPAQVVGRWHDVLASNPLADALHRPLRYRDNLARAVFLDPIAPSFYPDWDRAARAIASALRAAAGADLDHPRLTELVGELSLKSSAFRRLWPRHEVRCKEATSTTRFCHPDVGELTLDYESFSVVNEPGQHLLIYHAAPGSPSADALALLGSLAAGSEPGMSRQRSSARETDKT
ncbi:helix-turn-helix domain-containing protein [Nonomuraea lactucae]|uniref:helix-turn-helix domain-containing protein n=1 Tax=Nonomuraea lactucae TaxID=2249762 RepID=UPI000DE3F5F5|nr:helix-turn-helix domain-containing protein [Nonomuraea lactucae]